jgi:hypothetical protein
MDPQGRVEKLSKHSGLVIYICTMRHPYFLLSAGKNINAANQGRQMVNLLIPNFGTLKGHL